MIDTHVHLELIEEREEGGAEAVVRAAREAGITEMLNIGLGPDNAAVLERANRYPDVFATIGWHPHEHAPPTDEDLQRMRYFAEDPDVVAVGEIGLDYYWRPGYHEVPEEVQKESFRSMLALALELDLPVLIHDRDAHQDTLALLAEFPGVRGTMHAFSGDRAFAEACVAVGMHLSIGGPVTYPSAGALRAAVEFAPLDRLMLETDSPFLPPQPWRGQPNQPAYVAEVARKVAEVKGLSFEQVGEATSQTATTLFNLSR